jgi:hypothetical protein
MLLFNTNMIAQDTIALPTFKKHYFFISPLSLFDMVNPSFNVGYERFFNQRFSIQMEAAPMIKHSLVGYSFILIGFGHDDSWWRNKGGKARVKFKYYPRQNMTRHDIYYHSLELFATINHTKVEETFEIADSTFDYSNTDVDLFGDRYYQERYVHNRNRYGINYVFGLQGHSKDKISVEPFLGIGIVYEYSRQIGRSNMNDSFSDNPSNYFLRTNDRFFPNATIGVKFGIKR